MNREIRNFARRIATTFGLPPGLGEAIMRRKGEFSFSDEDVFPSLLSDLLTMGEEVYDPDSPKCRACIAVNGGKCPMESIGDSLTGFSSPFGLSGMGGMGLGTSTSVSVGVDKDGKATIMGRKLGSVLVDIPVNEFSDEIAVEAMQECFQATKAIQEGIEKIGKLRTETSELEDFCRLEEVRLRNTLWNEFSDFMGETDIEIVDADGTYQLIVNGQEQECEVNKDFGEKILARQVKLAEAKKTISANRELLTETTTMVDAKERILPHLKNGIITLVQKTLQEGESFVGLSETNDGKPILVISKGINETFDEIPEEMRGMIASSISGEDLPPEVLKALGIKPPIAENTEKEDTDKDK